MPPRARVIAPTIAWLAFASAAGAAPPPGFTDKLVASVGGAPTALAFTPDDRLLVATQGGELRVLDLQGLPLATAIRFGTAGAPAICSSSERGLLGIAVDPSFLTNGYVYLYYTANIPGVGCKNRVSRFTLDAASMVSPASELILLDRIHSTAGNHNGGDLHFGKDGLLYVSVGDGGCDYAGDSGCAGANDAARDRNVLLGKILRIESDGDIPAGNPFQGAGTARCNTSGSTTAGFTCQETFALGLRNPFRFTMDPNAAGTRFFINDVGQNDYEEIDEGIAGADYGWNCREGAHPNPNGVPASCPSPATFAEPVFEYSHDNGCAAITGGAFVPADLPWPPAYEGAYIYGDYVCGNIFRLSPTGGGGYTSTTFASGVGPVISMAFGKTETGEPALYYTTYGGGGEVRRIIFGGNRPLAVLEAQPTAGIAPLVVNFDGTGSSDPNGDALTYLWNFGNGLSLELPNATFTENYIFPGTFTATLRVRDTTDLVSAPASVTITVGDTAPTPRIVSPALGDLFSVGQTLTLSGDAFDLQEVIEPFQLGWEVRLRHRDHTHPLFGPAFGDGLTFVAPAPEDLEAVDESYLEVSLTTEDSFSHLRGTARRNVYPRRVEVGLDTLPSGLELLVNGRRVRTPVTVPSWAGYALGVSAADQADVHGHGHVFASWSDGGARAHSLVTPATNATYVASFDPRPALLVDDVTVAEGTGGTASAVFTVRLSDPAPGTVAVDYATDPGTATAGLDFTARSGSLTFDPGETSKTVAVEVQGDSAFESTESFFLVLSGATGDVVLGKSRGEARILDDDSGQRVEFAASRLEVREGTPGLAITVKRTGGKVGTVSVEYEALAGTARAPEDFEAVTGTLVFGPGVTSRTFRLPIVDDARVEGPETIHLALRNPSGAALGPKSAAVVTVTDNDAGGRLAFGAATYTVGERGPSVTLSVRRTGGRAAGVAVTYATVDGTAAAGSDYTESTGVLTFAAGQTEQAITIPVQEDYDPEGNETFEVVLSEPSGGAILGAPGVATVLLMENDDTIEFAEEGYVAKEGQKQAAITVIRNGTAAYEGSVTYKTSDGSAKEGEDYTKAEGTLRFPPGVRSRTFTVPITKDALDEGAEVVLLSLEGGTWVGHKSTAVLTLQDDDSAGQIAFSAASYRVKETAGKAVIAVRRKGGLAGGVTVAYSTTDGTAVAGTNYTSTSGTLSFGPGVTTESFVVPVLDDGVPTSDLTVQLGLQVLGGGAALGAPATAVLTLQSAEPLIQFTATHYRVREGAARAVIAVRRIGPVTGSASVHYAASDGTAVAPDDYAPTSGQLDFPPRVVIRTFEVPMVDDAEAEGDETVSLELSNPTGAGLGTVSTATLTITPDNPTLRFSRPAYEVAESAPRATITVLRSPPTTEEVSVGYATTGGTASAGTDYTPAAGTLVFPRGTVARTFTVPLKNDTLAEGGETVELQLSGSSSNATLGAPAVAILTIAGNDAAGRIQFEVPQYAVSQRGPEALVAVTRTGGIAGDVTVEFSTGDGTAAAWADYVPTAGTLTFGPGERTKTIAVTVLDNGLPDGSKSLTLTLANPGGGGALGALTTTTLWIVEN